MLLVCAVKKNYMFLSNGMWIFFNFFFFIAIKEISTLRKEMNRWLSKGMSNIYLKATIEEKNWYSQIFDFLSLKFVTISVLGSSNSLVEF